MKLRRGDLNQILLIVFGIAATALFGVFFYRELFPEYRAYQDRYVALEEFRSTYTHEFPPAFKSGVKQIVFEREDRGPAEIDRCTSCHVALEFPHFSPTKIAYDINGKMLFDDQGNPLQVPNEDYIWKKLDEKITVLKASGEETAAAKLTALKTVRVGDRHYDVTMALRAHPLIGREVRPFEFHPIAEYGCTSCHNGNGRGLTLQKAHGPVFDGDYETLFIGPSKTFLENDPDNDPKFARVFNGHPGHELLFQTTPIYVGALIQSKCMQCHLSSSSTLSAAEKTVGLVTDNHQDKFNRLQKTLNEEEESLLALLLTRQWVEEKGVAGTVTYLEDKVKDYSLPSSERQKILFRINFLRMLVGGDDGLRPQNAQPAKDVVLANLDQQIDRVLGSRVLAHKLFQELKGKEWSDGEPVDLFIQEHSQDSDASGSIFQKYRALEEEREIMRHIQSAQHSFSQTIRQSTIFQTDVDTLTKNYVRGQQLYLSQACAACHRIAGFTRGGVGPDLTYEGKTAYPWYIKKKIIWPQFDLKNSTMPNYRLDHQELEDLVTFILGQQGENQSISGSLYKSVIKDWESGKKMPWEKALTPIQMQDVNYAMTVFATEGCAACHRLKGFQSNVGFAVEKENPTFQRLFEEQQWFQSLIPETVTGSQIVKVLEKHESEIDLRILGDVRQDAILEEISEKFPDTIESFYSPFRYAARAKNKHFADLIQAEKDPIKKEVIVKKQEAWKNRVHRVLMMFVQEYGLGRLIGPQPNWSGVYRSDQWLMEHFRNPAAHVARSIMPIFPFDDTKFYALTHMLDVLGVRNRDAVREIWQHRGFDPQMAYQIHCAQCHGDFLGGNGPVAEWIYPIPKNLRNADFLRNMTRERLVYSIVHGVGGTPMPPWGEVGQDKSIVDGIPVLTRREAERLADWMLQSVPGGTVIRQSSDVQKWQYSPEDVIKDLKKEGSEKKLDQLKNSHSLLFYHENYLVSLEPVPVPQGLSVEDLFEISKNTSGSPDRYAYHIKQKYYTEENLNQGQLFFEANCAVCHGKEGDGSGPRGAVMLDAKPRMLTNLDWLDSQDDLRILRSIKFGVPGTSMSPWGDQTTSLQRLQLTMFIRSLTQEQERKSLLNNVLYKVFIPFQNAVEQIRIKNYPTISELEIHLDKALQQVSLFAGSNQEKAVEAYKKKLELTDQLNKEKAKDRLVVELQETVVQERKIFEQLGLSLIARKLPEKTFKDYLNLIESYQSRSTIQEGKVFENLNLEKIENGGNLEQQILEELDTRIQDLEQKMVLEEGKIPSKDRSQELALIKAEISGYRNMKQEFLSGMKEAEQLRLKQEQLIRKIKDTL